MAIEAVEVVIGCRGHEGNVGAVVMVKHQRVFHIRLVTPGFEVDLKDRFTIVRRGLSTLAMLVEQSQSAMENVTVAEPVPTVLHIHLPHVGLVKEMVMVVVHIGQVILVVSQHIGIQARGEVDVAIGIGFDAAIGVAIEVNGHARVILGFEVFHVDLSRNAFKAIAHR